MKNFVLFFNVISLILSSDTFLNISELQFSGKKQVILLKGNCSGSSLTSVSELKEVTEHDVMFYLSIMQIIKRTYVMQVTTSCLISN